MINENNTDFDTYTLQRECTRHIGPTLPPDGEKRKGHGSGGVFVQLQQSQQGTDCCGGEGTGR